MSGLRPPWTHSTAPPSFAIDPELEPDAPVPAGPVRFGVAIGELESIFDWESSGFELRGKRLIMQPSAFKISISISSSSLGIVA
jgi:hypothetical protein